AVTVGGVVSGAWTTVSVLVASLVLSLKSVARAERRNDAPMGTSAAIRWVASYGGVVTLAISTPSTANATDLTPTLSVAAAERCTVVPGAACDGAFRVTAGFSVSGSAEIVTLASAIAVLPLASRAVAVTRIVATTEATIGMEITRWYGGPRTGGGPGPAPSNVPHRAAA